MMRGIVISEYHLIITCHIMIPVIRYKHFCSVRPHMLKKCESCTVCENDLSFDISTGRTCIISVKIKRNNQRFFGNRLFNGFKNVL